MSATGRNEGVRQDKDHYTTPTWSIERLLEFYKLPRHGATVLDPCAANGGLLAALKILRPDLQLYAFELREECRPALQALVDRGVIVGFVIGDFLAAAPSWPENSFDYVVTNPPYSLAREFVDACTRIVRHANVQLLRINFLGSEDRREWTAHTNPGVLVLPNRPSFNGWGADATEYAWMVYGDPALSGRWHVLAVTPADVIAEWNAYARAMFPEANPKLRKRAAEAEAAASA